MYFNGKEFTVTEQHIALLKAAYVGWESCEFGAPAIDCKRPYGNSDVYGDMARILNIKEWNTYDENPEHRAWMEGMRRTMDELHQETQVVLQIILSTGIMQTGKYVRNDSYSRHWRLQLEPEGKSDDDKEHGRPAHNPDADDDGRMVHQ